jgi:hypothetical protein
MDFNVASPCNPSVGGAYLVRTWVFRTAPWATHQIRQELTHRRHDVCRIEVASFCFAEVSGEIIEVTAKE